MSNPSVYPQHLAYCPACSGSLIVVCSIAIICTKDIQLTSDSIAVSLLPSFQFEGKPFELMT
jgi:hypothetical protein